MAYRRTDEVLLDIKGVSLSFGSTQVLRDVNATIQHVECDEGVRGQVVAFLGPSGIGKTQLSRVIAGLQAPSSGQVTLKGVPTHAGRASMVPQFYPMFDYCTVADNLIIAGRQAGLNKADLNLKAAQFVEAFNLSEHLGKYPRELSGGTKQRVAIARQLMCAGHYMVMDEPFSGLDPIMKVKAQRAITQLARLNTDNTVIIVTHDVTEGLMVADMVWMMGLENGPDKVNTVNGPVPVKLPGARIVQEYDLAALGFAWREGLESDSEFLKFVRDVKDKFNTLR